MKKLLILFGLLLASPSFAADNSVIVTPGVGVTMRSKDVGSGVESMIHILGDVTGNPIYGTAGTANANILTVQGIASMTPFLATATLNAETTKVIGTVRNVGNVGGVFDAIGQNVAAPANWTQSGCQFNTTPTTITTGNGSPCQVDNAGNLLVNVKADATAAALLAAVQAPVPAGTNTIGTVGQLPYPVGAVPITASTTGTTAATTATLAASASIKTYICGFSIRANATAAATANSTVTGTITGTLNYTQWTAPAASGLGITEQIFAPCIPSSAINTAIAVISAAPGTGGVVSVSAWGYQL